MLKNISNIAISPTYHVSNKHRNKPVDNTDFQQVENPQDTSKTDSYLASISEGARLKAASKMTNAQDELDSMKSFVDIMKQQIKQAQEHGKAEANAMRTRLKCMLIATRIMQGDEVPKEDMRYLAKNDIELYNKAILMKIVNENPKKHNKISDDDKEPDSSKKINDISGIDASQFDNGSMDISDGITMETNSTATNTETE